MANDFLSPSVQANKHHDTQLRTICAVSYIVSAAVFRWKAPENKQTAKGKEEEDARRFSFLFWQTQTTKPLNLKDATVVVVVVVRHQRKNKKSDAKL